MGDERLVGETIRVPLKRSTHVRRAKPTHPVTVDGLDVRSIQQLQTSAGNKAVAQLLGGQRAVSVQPSSEATRATPGLGARAYTLSRHIAITGQPVGAPVVGADHSSERQARTGDGAATPLVVPVAQCSRGRMYVDWIEDAYSAGSLSDSQWRKLLNSSEQALAKGQTGTARSGYLTLYADAAKLAQASRVVTTSGSINVVTGTRAKTTDARPGLNISLRDYNGWGGARATTAYVDDHGNFGVRLNAPGAPQPLVAIVLSRDAFFPNKEETLGILRHEMVHAEHNAQKADETLSSPRAASPPVPISRANTELLAYFEGFMTIFHLADPVPTSVDHPAFVELLGALEVDGGIFPWAQADKSVRSEALDRFREYYCDVLDQRHREAFDGWLGVKLNEQSPHEADSSQESFFRSIKKVISKKCKVRTPMRL